MSNHVATVHAIYAAFGCGDIPGILAHVADDVVWEYDGVSEIPWLVPRLGPAGAAEFFQALAAIEITHFAVTAVVGTGDLVLATLDIDFTVRATRRKVVERDEVHVWHFAPSGKVAKFRHRADTLRQYRALRG